jgi:opacity protein-like surface antigen
MKKIALLAVVAALAASPAAAASKKNKPDDTFAKQNANTARILRDGLPLVLPTWSLPVYFNMHKEDAKAAPAHKHKKKRKM